MPISSLSERPTLRASLSSLSSYRPITNPNRPLPTPQYMLLSGSVIRDNNKSYVVRTHLGSGTYGSCYSVVDAETYEKFAIKYSKYSDTTAHGKRNIKEAKIGTHLHHENVVKLIRGFQFEDGYFVMMEYCKRGSLHTLLRRNYLKPGYDDSRFFIKEIAKGLEYLHSTCLIKPVIHCDLKPSNILVDSYYRLKIADFGLSYCPKLGDVKEVYRRGTRGYIAPEFYEKNIPTTASDIWSLGCCAFQIIKGFLPFKADTVPQKQVIMPWHDAAPVVKELFERCLEFVPAQRSTATSLLTELDLLTSLTHTYLPLSSMLRNGRHLDDPEVTMHYVVQLLSLPITSEVDSRRALPQIHLVYQEYDLRQRLLAYRLSDDSYGLFFGCTTKCFAVNRNGYFFYRAGYNSVMNVYHPLDAPSELEKHYKQLRKFFPQLPENVITNDAVWISDPTEMARRHVLLNFWIQTTSSTAFLLSDMSFHIHFNKNVKLYTLCAKKWILMCTNFNIPRLYSWCATSYGELAFSGGSLEGHEKKRRYLRRGCKIAQICIEELRHYTTQESRTDSTSSDATITDYYP